MSKKRLLCFILIAIIICIVIIFCIYKPTSKNSLNLDSSFKELSPPNNETAIVYLDNEEIKELSTDQQQELINTTPDPRSRESAITSPATPFFNKNEGWGANLLKVNDGSATVEITNISNKEITLSNDFVIYLGSNSDGSVVESKMETGAEQTLQPGETTQVKVTNGGDAKFIKIGFSNYPLDCALIPVQSFASRANDPNQIIETPEKQSVYVLDAKIQPYSFDKITVGCNYSRKISNTTYENIKLTKKEKQQYPYATLGYIELDIYNKHNEDLEITAIEYLYKQNGKVINTENLAFNKNIRNEQTSIFKVPFKYYGSGITTTIVLKTNFGNITINNPDTLFAVIKK